MTRIKILFFTLVLLTSCGGNNKTPDDILKPEKMQAVLWDVIKADAFTTEFIKKDTTKNAANENLKLQQQIFAIHKVTKDVFYESYDYYKNNSIQFKTLLDSMITKAERDNLIKTKPLMAE